MAKSKILTTDHDTFAADLPIVGQGGNVPKIKDVKPCGSQVLVEILTPQELMGTNLAVSNKVDLKVPLQGYVRAVGPGFKSDDWGFGLGDRVLISGSGVMAPAYDDCHRDRFFMEPASIKSVLVEG
jgi:hypothetical protein